MPDHVYILTNESMPGLLKIGYTCRTPQQRCAELGAATGIPTAFRLVHSREVSDGRAAEETIHRLLAPFRASQDREFFRLSIPKAIAAVDYCCCDFPVTDTDCLTGEPEGPGADPETLRLL